MEEQMELYIRLVMEGSGFHLPTLMDNDMYNPKVHDISPIRHISSNGVYLIVGIGFLQAQTPVVNYISDLGLRKLSIKDVRLSSLMGLAQRENSRLS
ncbi:hypothetical protein KFK09_004308 [Dendrobium nobile]|uniref:Uncharacterized protein n=1 Tax=Dendrobium nobile TaxID=94219 RepID=A0A8T3C5T9_DENNO|nr:hypothetical protein KFK09_004308 [Dendrobium nobile]